MRERRETALGDSVRSGRCAGLGGWLQWPCMESDPQNTPPSAVLDRVLEILKQLATEVGGDRAARAVTRHASLDKQIGLGSLERVELLARVQSAFGRSFDEGFLKLDTAFDIARAVVEGAGPQPQPTHDLPAAQPSLSAPPEDATTLHEALWRRAEAEPDRPSVYLRQEDGREDSLSYGQLLKEAALVAGGLREEGLRRGDTVALMLPTGRDFLRAFQGALIAGAVPVPIYPPMRLDRFDEYLERQASILANAGVRLLLTFTRATGASSRLRQAVPTLEAVKTADELSSPGVSWGAPEGAGTDPALIQYTSGSTGAPKGVLLSHDNLLANIRAMGRALDLRWDDVGVSWLPLYHDMGLIGSWLFCTYHGVPIALESPLAFLARPERWLWTIHRRRGTLSAGPNFAYELCVRKIPDEALEGIDLSSWRGAFNGAEPVNPETLERFSRRFAPYGFQPEAAVPVYGLAECSVALCVAPMGREPRIAHVARGPFEREGRAEPVGADEGTALRFASVGSPIPGHEVRILSDGGDVQPPGTVGRIAFRGPSQMQGYFRNPTATAAISLGDGWLDTGDLGYQADGELYVTGRLKDLIIKAGRNLVPQEIEEAASEVPGIRKGCVVAFGVPHPTLGTERLVVVAETRVTEPERRAALASAVAERVATAVGLPPDQVELVVPGSVPKTSSGKLRRDTARQLHLGGTLGATAGPTPFLRPRLLTEAAWAELRRLLRTPRRWLYGAYLAVALLPPAFLAWALAASIPARALALALPRRYFGLALRAAGCRLAVEGLENLPPRGAVLMASNHASYVDVAALMALLPRDFLFVAKREVLGWPAVGTFVRRAGHLTVDRNDTQQSLTDAAAIGRSLAAGQAVLVFPEGTFTSQTGLRPFRLGAFSAAVESRLPIVPLALRGTRGMLRDGVWIPRPGPVRLWIGRPIPPEGSGWRAVMELRDRVADAIAEHCGEPRLDILAGGAPRP